LKTRIDQALREQPDLPYEEIHRRFLASHEGQVRMNQISPRIFEAIAARTALVLFEGEYSGVILPHLHFIPLSKDFSNVDQVLAQLDDLELLTAMTERAYRDVVASGKYSYSSFGSALGSELRRMLGRGPSVPVVRGLLGRQEAGRTCIDLDLVRRIPADHPQHVAEGLAVRSGGAPLPGAMKDFVRGTARAVGRIAAYAGADQAAIEDTLLTAAKTLSRSLRRGLRSAHRKR
jgi:hypothetical protein